MGYQPDCEMRPGEQLFAVISHVFHGKGRYKNGPIQPYTGVVLSVSQAKLNTALANQKRCLFLRGTYRQDFLGGQWGINDYLSVGYGGQKEPGSKTSKHLLYIQGQRQQNSRFIPVPDHVMNLDEEETFENAPQAAAPAPQMEPAPAPQTFQMPIPQMPQQQQQQQQQTTNPNPNPGVPTFN